MANTIKNTTKQGSAMFAHLLKTEAINGKDTGKYTLQVALDREGQAAVYKDVKDCWAAFLATPEMANKTVSETWNNGFRKYKDVVYAKFSSASKIHTRRGDVIDITVPIFDGAGNPLQGLKNEIGNGSVVKVAYECYPYYISANLHGVSLRLRAVQVLELKTYNGGSASSFGFGTDGPAINVEAANAPAPADDGGFDDDAGYWSEVENNMPVDNDGDF